MKVKICIVVSTYNNDITQKLYSSAKEELDKSDIKKIDIVKVPGAFEIPVAISKLVKKYDGFIAVGCIIKGETANFDLKTFRNKLDGSEHYAITKGKFTPGKSSRVRVISTNVLNSFFNFNKDIFKNSLKYLNKFNNFALILVKGTNPNPASSENNRILRYYGVGAQIIKELKIKNMILVSRSKKRIIALKGYSIKITKQEIIK